jgi:type VI secretion system protein ImpK
LRLSDFYIPLLAYVRDFEQSPSGSAEELSGNIESLIERAKKNAVAAGYAVDEFNGGLFAVAAWTDERISGMKNWEGRYTWQKFLLQRRYFKTSLAGVEFFKRLSELPERANQVRELYLLALYMGFLGKFINDPFSSDLLALKQSQYELLPNTDKSTLFPSQDPLLFPFAYQEKKPEIAHHAYPWLGWFTPRNVLVFLLPPILLLGLVIYLNWQLSFQIDQFRDLISK